MGKKGSVIDSRDVEKEKVKRADMIDIQWLIAEDECSDNIYLRKFTIKPGGSMGYHKHYDTEHLQYVLNGNIRLVMDEEEHILKKGNAVFIPKGVPHSYENPGDVNAEFLCIIPSGDVETEILE